MLLLEVSDEVAFIIDAHLRQHFFQTQKRLVHQLSRTLETHALEILRRRQAGFVLEQVTQTRRREID